MSLPPHDLIRATASDLAAIAALVNSAYRGDLCFVVLEKTF